MLGWIRNVWGIRWIEPKVKIIDHEITLKMLEFIFHSIDKVKSVFYLPQRVFFLNWTGQNPNLTAFTSKIQVFCRPEWTNGGIPWKRNLTIFKCKNEFPKQLGFEKQMKRMRSFILFSCLIFKLWSCNCLRLCSFCNILLMSAKI